VQAPPKAEEVPWSYAVDRIAIKDAKLGFVDELAPSGPGKLDIGPVNVDIANLASTGDKLRNSMPHHDRQRPDHQAHRRTGLKPGTLNGTLETAGVRPQGFSAWWPRELRSQFGDTGINAELHYKMAWSQPVFQFTLEKSRLELSPVYVATREPVVCPLRRQR
jgi:hypothetical protein